MSTVSEIAFAARELTLEEQRALLSRLASNLKAEESKSAVKERVFGLGKGRIWMADDFNDPLPDEFWLSEDAYTGKDPNDRAS
ncbi:MAG: hypothetical protein JNM65_13205 [Verrucomicrobiaceae bacterium]|nr:hypothetical protein [Verrucomicrobiaceae bacterium]